MEKKFVFHPIHTVTIENKRYLFAQDFILRLFEEKQKAKAFEETPPQTTKALDALFADMCNSDNAEFPVTITIINDQRYVFVEDLLKALLAEQDKLERDTPAYSTLTRLMKDVVYAGLSKEEARQKRRNALEEALGMYVVGQPVKNDILFYHGNDKDGKPLFTSRLSKAKRYEKYKDAEATADFLDDFADWVVYDIEDKKTEDELMLRALMKDEDADIGREKAMPICLT